MRAGAPADAMDDVVVAAEQLARAVARATPGELARAEAELAFRASQLALPAPGALPAPAPSFVRAVRAALAPPPAPPEPNVRAHQALLTTVVLAMVTRIPRTRPSVRAWATAHLLPRVRAARALLAR